MRLRCHGGLQLLHKGSRGAGSDLFSLAAVTEPKKCGAVPGEDQKWALQDNGHVTKLLVFLKCLDTALRCRV